MTLVRSTTLCIDSRLKSQHPERRLWVLVVWKGCGRRAARSEGARSRRVRLHDGSEAGSSFDGLCLHCRDQPSRPHYVHDAGEIVGVHVQRHLGGDAHAPPHFLEHGAHHPPAVPPPLRQPVGVVSAALLAAAEHRSDKEVRRLIREAMAEITRRRETGWELPPEDFGPVGIVESPPYTRRGQPFGGIPA
jgi:hypothetical protein